MSCNRWNSKGTRNNVARVVTVVAYIASIVFGELIVDQVSTVTRIDCTFRKTSVQCHLHRDSPKAP
jgi:hypothetical protein